MIMGKLFAEITPGALLRHTPVDTDMDQFEVASLPSAAKKTCWFIVFSTRYLLFISHPVNTTKVKSNHYIIKQIDMNNTDVYIMSRVRDKTGHIHIGI